MKGKRIIVDGAVVFLDFAEDVELSTKDEEVLREFVRGLRERNANEQRTMEQRMADAAKKRRGK